eukprot:4729505-Amphidinium_carterae.1
MPPDAESLSHMHGQRPDNAHMHTLQQVSTKLHCQTQERTQKETEVTVTPHTDTSNLSGVEHVTPTI